MIKYNVHFHAYVSLTLENLLKSKITFKGLHHDTKITPLVYELYFLKLM